MFYPHHSHHPLLPYSFTPGKKSTFSRSPPHHFSSSTARLPSQLTHWTGLSHTCTIVRECCKGDNASQWRNPKFDPPPPRSNPKSDSHKSWQKWLRRGPIHLCKSYSRFAQGFRFRACVTLHTKSVYSASFFHVFPFLWVTAKFRSILTQNMPKHAVPHKDVPFRGRDHKI